MIYLDYSATTPLRSEVATFLQESYDRIYGNPSSLHRLGIESEKHLKKAKVQLAKVIGATEKEIYLTSGGTEANNLALLGYARRHKKKGNHVLISATEHASVLNAGKALEEEGFRVTYVAPTAGGLLDIVSIQDALQEDTILVSVMHVNNETGAINPIGEIGKLLSDHQAAFHVDAVQSYGKLPIDVKTQKIDLLSASGHKIYGPKGIGFLYVKAATLLKPLFYGGQQEVGLRPGTENLQGAMAFGYAASLMEEDRHKLYGQVQELKDHFLRRILEIDPSCKVVSPDKDHCSPYILNLSFPGLRGEVLLHTLEAKGVYVSTGSACNTKKKTYSHVLEALGLSDEIKEGAIRLSFGLGLTHEEMEKALIVFQESIHMLSKIMKRG